MLEIYIDNVLIDDSLYMALTNNYELYRDNFYLGAVASNTFSLDLNNEGFVFNKDSEVVIIDDDNTHKLFIDKVEEHRGFIRLNLADKMLNFNFYYSAEELIEDNRVEGDSTTTIQDILYDICDKAGVECNYTLKTTNHIVDWWDNRITARDYLSFIAEKEGSFARIENDELVLVEVNSPSKLTIDEGEISDLIIGEKKEITRVVYDNGVGTKWEFGDDVGNTLYLYQNNPYILEEKDVEDIFDMINGFEFYSIEVPNAPIDSSVMAGDVITFKDENDNEYPTIAQYNLSYGGGWIGGYKLDIKTAKQEETSIGGLFDSVKSFKTVIDRTENRMDIVVEDIGTNQSNIATLFFNTNTLEGKVEEEITNLEGQIEENKTLVQQTKESILATIQSTSGTNLIRNSVMFSLDEEGNPHSWTLESSGTLTVSNDSVSINYGGLSGRSFTLNEKIISQRINVVEDKEENQNKVYYSFSCLLKKTAGGYAKISIYNALENHEVFIPIGESKNYEKIVIENLLPKMDYYYVELAGIEATFTDPMFSVGEHSSLWTQASGEAMNTSIQMSLDGIKVLSQLYEGAYNIMSPFEFAGYSTVNGTLTKVFTLNKETTEVEKLKSKSEIGMPPIKIIPFQEGAVTGWAFVKGE